MLIKSRGTLPVPLKSKHKMEARDSVDTGCSPYMCVSQCVIDYYDDCIMARECLSNKIAPNKYCGSVDLCILRWMYMYIVHCLVAK